jgi:hypothetical protein
VSTLLYQVDFTSLSGRGGAAGSLVTAVGGGTDFDSSWALDTNGLAWVAGTIDFTNNGRNWFVLPDGTGPVQDQLAQARIPANQAVYLLARMVASGTYAAGTRKAYLVNCKPLAGSIVLDWQTDNTTLGVIYNGNASFPSDSANDYYLTLICKGVSPTTLYIQLCKGTAPNTPIMSWAGTDNTAGLQIATGHIGMFGQDAQKFHWIDSYSYNGVITGSGLGATATQIPPIGGSMVSPALSLSGQPRKTVVSLSAVPASGGTAPISYYLHVKDDLNIAYSGHAVGVGTCIQAPAIPTNPTALAVSNPPAGLHFYALEAVDSSATPIDQFSSVWVPAVAPANADLVIFATGDSTTANANISTEGSGAYSATWTMPQLLANAVGQALNCYCQAYNGGHSGFLISQVDPTNTPGKTTLDSDLTSFQSMCAGLGYVGPKYGTFLWGFNDVHSATPSASYLSSLNAILNYLLNTGANGLTNSISILDKIFLVPMWIPQDGSHSGLITNTVWPSWQAFNANLATAAAGFPGKVYAPSATFNIMLQNAFANNYALVTQEGLHENSMGASALAYLHAENISAILNPATPAGGLIRGAAMEGGIVS